MERSFAILLMGALLSGCTKERDTAPLKAEELVAGRIVVNELVAAGSVSANEFGAHADWIELYNPGPEIRLEPGAWYLTDDGAADPHKFELPDLELPEQGFVRIWCDGEDFLGDEVHANFSLSEHDGQVHLIHLSNGADRLIDAVPVDRGNSGDVSMGRTPDGTDSWTRLSPQTPGAPNELAAEP